MEKTCHTCRRDDILAHHQSGGGNLPTIVEVPIILAKEYNFGKFKTTSCYHMI